MPGNINKSIIHSRENISWLNLKWLYGPSSSSEKIFSHLCVSYVRWPASSATPEGEPWVRSRHLLGGATKTTNLRDPFPQNPIHFGRFLCFFCSNRSFWTYHFRQGISLWERFSPFKRYLEVELRDGEDLPNCYDQVRQKNTCSRAHKNFGSGDPPPLYKVFNEEGFTKLEGPAPLYRQNHPFQNHTEYDDSTSGMESLSGTSKIGSAAGSTPTSARLALRWSLKL